MSEYPGGGDLLGSNNNDSHSIGGSSNMQQEKRWGDSGDKSNFDNNTNGNKRHRFNDNQGNNFDSSNNGSKRHRSLYNQANKIDNTANDDVMREHNLPSSEEQRKITLSKVSAETSTLKKKLKKKKKEKKKKEKKKEKKRKKKHVEKRGNDVNIFGYSNHENPFNDPNLNKQFVWGKKSGAKVLSREQLQDHRLAVVKEVEKVKRRREEREREREERENAMEEARREREREQNGNNMEQEEKFHANILREKTFRRVNAGAPDYVDLFVNNIIKLQKLRICLEEYKIDVKAKDIEKCMFELYLESPIQIIKNIQADELTTLYFQLEDLERSELVDLYRVFYNAIKSLVYKRANDLGMSIYDEPQDCNNASQSNNSKGSIHHSVIENVHSLLDNKTKAELIALRAETLSTDSDNFIDGDFKTEVLKQIETRLNNITAINAHKEFVDSHQKLMDEYIILYKERHIIVDGGNDNNNLNEIVQTQSFAYPFSMIDENGNAMNKNTQIDGNSSMYSNMNGTSSDTVTANKKFHEAMNILQQEAELDKEDTGFGAAEEVSIKSSEGIPWAEKFAPRKPKYFNRVRSGYDWSGYNRTHYDTDNPPPKIVQGYKFNIFYPDLINPKIAPTYRLAPANDQDFCIIHFSAGPPYEDIAFRIVNKEWAKGKRRGFRCTYDRGILQLYFNFTRTRYRR